MTDDDLYDEEEEYYDEEEGPDEDNPVFDEDTTEVEEDEKTGAVEKPEVDPSKLYDSMNEEGEPEEEETGAGDEEAEKFYDKEREAEGIPEVDEYSELTLDDPIPEYFRGVGNTQGLKLYKELRLKDFDEAASQDDEFSDVEKKTLRECFEESLDLMAGIDEVHKRQPDYAQMRDYVKLHEPSDKLKALYPSNVEPRSVMIKRILEDM